MTHEAFGTIFAEKHFEQLDRAGWEYSVEATGFSVLIPDEGLYCTVGLYSRQAISPTIIIRKSELIAHHMEDGTECWKVECLSVAPSISWHHISWLRRRFGMGYSRQPATCQRRGTHRKLRSQASCIIVKMYKKGVEYISRYIWSTKNVFVKVRGLHIDSSYYT